MHFAYSQCLYRFVPRILSIQTDSFRHSQNINGFILQILTLRADSSRVFREWAQIILNIRNGIILPQLLKGYYRVLQKQYECVQLDQKSTRIMDYLALHVA